MLIFFGTVMALAITHFVLAYLVTGLANTPILLGVAKVFQFPSHFFPKWIGENDWLFVPAFFLSCFLFWTVLVGIGFLAYTVAGIKATALVFLLFLIVVVTYWWKLSNPPPDWNTQAYRYMDDYYLFLPEPIKESKVEHDKYETIFRTLHPKERFRPPATRRWYWKYRPTLSGFPKYHAVVVATPASVATTREEFLKQVSDQSAGPSWMSSDWEKVSETNRWTLETAIPNRASKASSERNRLIRVVATSPSKGVWIGLMALETKMSRDIAISIVERAMDSVCPFTEDAPPQPAPATPAPPEFNNA